MAKKKIGKNQVDLEPIGIAILKVQKKLGIIKKKGKLTPKQKIEVGLKLFKLDLLYKMANLECCDHQWFCPCPDPFPLSEARKALTARRK